MSRILKNPIKIFIPIFFLIIFQRILFCEERTPKTVITVLEGEVSCVDYPKWVLKEVALGEVRSGILVGLESEDIAIVDIYTENIRAYIPDIVKEEIGDKLVPDSLVLLKKNIRRIHGTNWDLIAVEKRVKAGFNFRDNMVKEISLEDFFSTINIWEGMQEVYKGMAGKEVGVEEVGVTGTNVRELSFIDHQSMKEEEGESPTSPPSEPTAPPSSTAPTPEPQSSDRYVDADSGNDSSDGTSWATAWKTISYALTQVSGTNIYIRGTFNSTTQGSMPITINSEQNLNFIEKDGTAIFDGGSTSRIFNINSSTNIFFFDLTFQNGLATGESGGAVSCTNSTVGFQGCTFSSNTTTAPGTGGAISLNSSSTVAISDCAFSNNTGGGGGGAIVINNGCSLISTFTVSSTTYSNSSGSSFTNNTCTGVTNGKAIFVTSGGSLALTNGAFTFTSNVASNGNGGAIYIDTPSTLNISRCTFSSNSNIQNGAAIYCNGATSSHVIQKCTFNSNTAGNTGGAIFLTNSDINIYNCLFYDNTATASGGAAIYCDNGSDPRIFNCTFHNNTANGNQGNGIFMTGNSDPIITNCILTHNSGLVLWATNETEDDPVVTFSDCYDSNDGGDNTAHDGANGNGKVINFAGWGWSGTGCIGDTAPDDNPDYKNAGANDFRINFSTPSPCRDASTTIAVITDDIAGTSRPQGAAYDMGCYEAVSGDPAVTGRIYDSVTGETISSPTVAIYRSGDNTPLSITISNPFTFNVDPGSYLIAVTKSEYGFPSQIVSSVVSGDHGDVFTVGTEALNIDIPMDPDGWLYIEKTVNKKHVIIGEIVTYNIKIQNKHWYKSVSNVELVDEIVNGFKYVSSSTYKGSGIQSDPEISGRKAIFNLGTVSANSTVNLNYQVRVGAGIPPGRYKAGSFTRKSTTGERNSNISSVNIEVIEDPLFTNGTIIGKVFLDLNGNRIQDGEEAGVAGVKIYTEYGVCVETDEDGKYHIADVPPGRHLLKVDLPGSAFTTENPYYVKITEGLLAKVNFGTTEGTEKEPQITQIKNKFFIVALGEGEVRKVETSGNIEMVEKDDRYDEGLKVDGRLALFLKGKILGKYLITASLDTERRSGGKYDTRRLFTNLDPDKYYPVYGDSSQVDYSGVDTQDILYILIEWDESFAKWGSFHTGIPLYERTMSGGIIEYKSVGKTKFGDDKTNIKIFGAFSRQMPAHDELVGTGGSLYYLRHRDIIEGSEKVKVEIRNRISKRTISVIYLREEIDYEIDYDTGRLLLRRPLNSITQPYTGSIISNDLLSGNQAYIVADYEYYSSEGLSNQAEGIKGSQWIGNHIRIGGAYIEEQRPDEPYKLMGGDATIKISPKIQVDGSYNRTKETLLDNGMSYNGGITFIEQGENHSSNKSGSAININTTAELFKNTDLYLEYSRQDPYYSISGSIANQGSQKYLADIIHRLTKNLTFGISHITQKYLKGTIGSEIIGSTRSDTTSGVMDYRKGKWDIRTEYQHREVENSIEQDYDTYFGSLPLLKNDFIAARVGYELLKWLHPYIRGQITINGPSNDQGTIGSSIRLWEDGELDLSYTKGTIGDSALLGLTTRYGEDTDIYTNIETGSNLGLGRYIKTSYGQTTITKEGEKIYAVQDYSTYRERFIQGNILGYDKKINDTLTLGLTYERSNINERRLDIDRDSGSVGISYLNDDILEGIKGFNKIELRQDKGTQETRQWLTQNDILLKATKSLNLTGRCNWGWTEDRDSESDLAEFYELGTGFSYRPPLWDKLNILGKYSYIMDLGPEEQTDFSEISKALKNVYAIEGIYDLFTYISLVGKIAYRQMSEKVGPRDWVDSDTYLYIGRVNFHIIKKWDIATEYRIFANKQIEDSKSGWLFEVDRDITEYIRLGIGYNFTDYDDDLRNDDSWDSKGWFVRVSGKY